MIGVKDVVEWSDVRQASNVDGHELRRVQLTTRDLHGAVIFYSQLFGLRPSLARSGRTHRSAVVSVTPKTDLVIDERKDPRDSDALAATTRCAFVVGDLDWARQVVWDLGIRVATASEDPDQIFRWPNARPLYVYDPDANQIELLELGADAHERRSEQIARSARRRLAVGRRPQ